MVKNRMMEDAVGLYLQLGKEYPNVVVRDGKTGADFMTDLLTDKRLLPYPGAEPLPAADPGEGRAADRTGAERPVRPVRGRAARATCSRCTAATASCSIRTIAGNGSWTLRGVRPRRRAANEVQFPALTPAHEHLHQLGSIPCSKFVQANGQLLLVQLGTRVYCFDLAEKKERWQKNLLGENSSSIRAAGQGRRSRWGPDGEVTVKYDDGYIITLGKSTVLQAGYAASSPATGWRWSSRSRAACCWTRRDITERTQLYGDARYIVLVETDVEPQAGRGTSAAGGGRHAVEGSADSGRVLADGASRTRSSAAPRCSPRGPASSRACCGSSTSAPARTCGRRSTTRRRSRSSRTNAEWTGFVKPNGEAEIIDDADRARRSRRSRSTRRTWRPTSSRAVRRSCSPTPTGST